MIFIYGDSFKNHIIAIVCPEPDTLKTFCRDNNLANQSLTEMIRHKQVRELIQNDMQRLAKENKFNSLE
jgi:long-subunit acyl-CoA synthetase (AMP-forming)